MFGANNNRPAGVLIPENISTEQAPQQKIVNFSWCQFAAIEYGDAEGRKHTTILMKLGGQWYFSPNGEAWATAQRPATEWMLKALKEQEALHPAPASSFVPVPDGIPTKDDVDVLGGAK
jgi:hypothetical protein